MHSQISQHTVCPQAATPPLSHIYSIKSMCKYSAYVIVCVSVCVYAWVCANVCVTSQSPLFHKVFFLSVYCLRQLLDVE
jgi:hypothetical protein